ncbi:hypothetical protein [Saccharolobus islandicus]|jgi:hypothetical protein|uniref:Uncharacterized protein n=1 Tax=Saccharolobus islandicus (strain L.D.8.5 / Lassen \|nr:hypothetical protein [Sulfolobus islandicus]ADB86250.1 hypothetical protein LD85_0479 [Sulfolobus islandicus L.D.8.5]
MVNLIGEIPYNLLVIENYNFWVINDRLISLIDNIPTAKYLIENLPSEVILSQVFNGKIKFGNLIISIVKPSVVIAPYYVIKTLKEWDLIVHSEKVVNEQLIVTITNNLCEEKVIGINPYDISSKLIQKKLITECGTDHVVDFVYTKVRFRNMSIPLVLYKSEAEKLGYKKHLNLNLSIDFYVSLFKNATNVEVEAYEKIREFLKNEFRN